MRVYTYILAHDTGFAPNPFHGWCTLACCKPKIRSSASVGDWVVGLTPRVLGNRLAYFMRVEEKVTFDDYYRDPRFRKKRPNDVHGQPLVRRCGDNCYEPTGDGDYRQLPCSHSEKDGAEDLHLKASDLSGRFVLAGREFGYFGVDAVELAPDLAFMIPGRGHRVNFSDAEQERVLSFLEKLRRGCRGRPRHWRPDDDSWKGGRRCV